MVAKIFTYGYPSDIELEAIGCIVARAVIDIISLAVYCNLDGI